MNAEKMDMEEQKKKERPVTLDSQELEKVTGGSAWKDDSESIENYRRERSPQNDGIVSEPSEKAGPVTGAGVLDRLALGMDRVKEGITSIATRD